ncbi:jg3181 [Pararge aegeria aegeria]|uniref:Jg3181 protein n=1 Tax=Pararge aegeria aegeria TaxID=348720 RepID=A0A8S4QPB3_9NEOP|nr:jg3181 [Pararge aegeria aegeria]
MIKFPLSIVCAADVWEPGLRPRTSGQLSAIDMQQCAAEAGLQRSLVVCCYAPPPPAPPAPRALLALDTSAGGELFRAQTKLLLRQIFMFMWVFSYKYDCIIDAPKPPDVVEPWGSSHGELSRSPHSPGDAVATPQVVIGKCPSEK